MAPKISPTVFSRVTRFIRHRRRIDGLNTRETSSTMSHEDEALVHTKTLSQRERNEISSCYSEKVSRARYDHVRDE